MKKGYHSTQRKYFRMVPRSEFYGMALGYAVGMILSGLLHDYGQKWQIICLCIGVAIGYWIDGKYFAEKDVDVQEIETQLAEEGKIVPKTDSVPEGIDETDPDYDGEIIEFDDDEEDDGLAETLPEDAESENDEEE